MLKKCSYLQLENYKHIKTCYKFGIFIKCIISVCSINYSIVSCTLNNKIL